MKKMEKKAAPLRRRVEIVVDRKDPRTATVVHEGKVIFTIKTDVSGMHPSIIVVATESHLKSMEKGTTGIALWNGAIGLNTRNLKLN